MNIIKQTAAQTPAGVAFIISGVNYCHDGKNYFSHNGAQWVAFNPDAAPAAAPVNALPAPVVAEEVPVKTRDMYTMYNMTVLGNLPADPTFNTATTGVLCCNFKVTVKDYYKGVERREYISISCFGKAAEVQRGVLRKGFRVLVTVNRKPHTQASVGTDGVKRWFTTHYANDIHWMNKKGEDSAYAAPPAEAAAAALPQPNAVPGTTLPQPDVAAQPAEAFVADYSGF